MSSPVFVARFADRDHTVIRMTVWHSEDRKTLDLRRGLVLAREAYGTRVRNRERRTDWPPKPVDVPPIIAAHFEDTSSEPARVLAEYDAEAVKKASP